MSLFNGFGFDDSYASGFPARGHFAATKLGELDGTEELARLIEHVLDPLEFRDSSHDHEAALRDVNAYLERDGWRVELVNGVPRVLPPRARAVDFSPPGRFRPSSGEFIRENVEKCERKLREGDHRGAITNARSLCEDVLADVERRLDPAAGPYDGDLPKLWKRARKALRMDADGYKEMDAVVQLLRGLVTVLDGLSGMSNAMGDRHGGASVRPKAHHAALAVNAANTLCTFVLASLAHQLEAPVGSAG